MPQGERESQLGDFSLGQCTPHGASDEHGTVSPFVLGGAAGGGRGGDECTQVTLSHPGSHRQVREEILFYRMFASKISESAVKYRSGKHRERIEETCVQLKQKLAGVSVICDTRFCQSERRVYKQFFRNLVYVLLDMEAEHAIHADIAPLKSVTFVIHLAGTVDLLAHVKNLSLKFQTVNQLPWELEDERDATLTLLTLLAADLRRGDVTRTLPGDARSRGLPVPALELLAKHLPEIKQLKLTLSDRQGNALRTVKLADVGDRRESRNAFAAMGIAAGGANGPRQQAALQIEISKALSDLADLAAATVRSLRQRLQPPTSAEGKWLLDASRCLDLRKMAYDPTYCRSDASEASLLSLWTWLAQRDQVDVQSGVAAAAVPEDLPPFSDVLGQFRLLSANLQRAAARDLPYSKQWKGASGTVLMRDVFTNRRFYADCDAYLYLFQQIALKTMCEAVVEGMGGVWDAAADPRRHPEFKTGVAEAVVAWYAPWPYRPEAETFLRSVLTHAYPGRDWQHVFTNIDSRSTLWAHGSKTVTSHIANDAPRLPAHLYDIKMPRPPPGAKPGRAVRS